MKEKCAEKIDGIALKKLIKDKNRGQRQLHLLTIFVFEIYKMGETKHITKKSILKKKEMKIGLTK